MFSLALAAALTMAPAGGCGSYGNYSYSPYYQSGYSYYSAGYYGTNTYYPAGYYSYQPSIYITKYVPYYVPQPVAFTTYQPAALVTQPLAAISQFSQVQATNYGVAAVPAIPTVNVGTVATVGVNAVGVAPIAGATLGAAPSKCDAALAAMNDRMARIEAALMQPKPKTATAKQEEQLQAKPKAETPNNLAELVARGKVVFIASCSKCHKQADAAKGSPKLFEGNEPIALSCQTMSDCKDSVLDGSMPKRGPMEEGLNNQDGQALIAYFVSQSKAAKAAAKGK